MSQEIINFYEPWDPYGYYCNLSAYPVYFDGMIWPTSEHCYQAMKHADPAYRERVRLAKTPEEAIALGRDESAPDYRHVDWMAVRVDLMYQIVKAKFSQHPDLKKILLGTGDAILREHTPKDAFWGDHGDGTGENWLGRCLMRVRDELRQESK